MWELNRDETHNRSPKICHEAKLSHAFYFQINSTSPSSDRAGDYEKKKLNCLKKLCDTLGE